MDTDLVEKIETQRAELEANIAKLRKSLHHWTALELDYEGLKDEFQTLRDGASKHDCMKAAHDFAPQKVGEKELIELIEPSRGKVRSPTQIVDLLSKRVDYVLRNTESLKKQISDLEKRRNAILLAAHPEHEAEAALPLAEITEELDEDGNILSSKVQQQGDTAKKVLEVLQKTKVQPVDNSSPQKRPSELDHNRIEELDSSEDDEGEPTDGQGTSHSEATEVYPRNSNDNEEEAQMRQEMINYGLGEVGNIVAELELADAQNEALDDEELLIDDVDVDDDEDEDEYDDSDELMDDEFEDESGRMKTSIHTDKYRNQMEQLQKQLGLNMENIGPSPEAIPDPNINGQINYMRDSEFDEQMDHLPPEFRKRFGRLSAAQAARAAAIAREEASKTANQDVDIKDRKSTKSAKRKQVAFAPTVNIAPSSSMNQPTTMSDIITEHAASDITPSKSALSTKVSRFKAARSIQPQTPLYPPPMATYPSKQNDSSAPTGKTIVQDLIERPGISSAKDAPPPDADDFDEELQRRQIALEHHQLRNKIIHEQGGYVKGGEAENWGDAYAAPKIEDPKTGEPVKISRFKAARLRP